MIDEKKIEEAAKDYASKRPIIINCGARIGFEAGINWFLDNLWHDASEEPPYYKKVLVDFKHKCPRLESFNGLCDYDRMCKALEITRWLDIADLLKGGK